MLEKKQVQFAKKLNGRNIQIGREFGLIRKKFTLKGNKIMANTTTKATTATKKTSPNVENFGENWAKTYNTIYEESKNRDSIYAFKGQDPHANASDKQRELCGQLGIALTESSTKLSAHAAIQSAKLTFPDRFNAVMEENAKKAGKESNFEPKNYAAKAYYVDPNSVNTPASYAQTIHLHSVRGADNQRLREFNDASPLPTKGEVAAKLNAVREANPEEYNRGMNAADKAISEAKHKPPTEGQLKYAEANGIKVTPFQAQNAETDTPQKGSTQYSVGGKIFDDKNAKAAAAPAAPAAPAIAVAAPAAPVIVEAAAPATTLKEKAQAKLKKGAEQKVEGEQAKLNPVATLQTTSKQATKTADYEGPNA